MNPLAFYLPLLVKLTALAALAWAGLKVVLIAQSLGLIVALVFAGLHLPICVFSSLLVLWFFDEYQAVGFLALTNVLFNALLI